MKKYFSCHNHSNDGSNLRLKDSIIKVDQLLDYALEIGLSGLAITDHEALSAHPKAMKIIESNPEKFKDFKLALGDEVYLIDRLEHDKKREAKERINYHHFILIAKDFEGYQQLRKISSQAWDNSYGSRVPTYKDFLKEVIDENPGHLIASTACLGGEIPNLLRELYSFRDFPSKQEPIRSKIESTVLWFKTLFKDDFYFELQPSTHADQKMVNRSLISLGKSYNVRCIVTTDSHYLKATDKEAHTNFLRSRIDSDREEIDFYETTYLMNSDEIESYFDGIDTDELFRNTLEIESKIQKYSIAHGQTMPPVHIPENFERAHKLYDKSRELLGTNNEYIEKFYMSLNNSDTYLLKCLEDGVKRYWNDEYTVERIERIEIELKEIRLTSEGLNENMANYFLATKESIDLMWKYSIVGPARGSAACFVTNFLLGIVQVDALKYDLPHWRFLTHERLSLPDKYLVWNI